MLATEVAATEAKSPFGDRLELLQSGFAALGPQFKLPASAADCNTTSPCKDGLRLDGRDGLGYTLSVCRD